MKKRVKKKPSALRFRLFLAGLFALLLLSIWAYNNRTDETPPENTNQVDVMQDDIGQIISPMLADDTFTLVFEDQLPDPILTPRTTNTSGSDRHQLAIIIDDVGYDLHALRRLLALPFTLTVAILPDAPHAKEAAQMAHQHGIKVMLHMPMETMNPKYQQKMERFYLHQALDKQTFTKIFEDALAKVPYVEGINNHMGSALTSNAHAMQWLMELCIKHDLFFIDSRTSSKSVAASLAQKNGLYWNARDIFLDHSIKPDALQHAWDSAVSCTQRNDHCVVLAHPHKETLHFLEQFATGLNLQAFVPISEVLKHR